MKLVIKVFLPVLVLCVGAIGAYALVAAKPVPEVTDYVPKDPPVQVLAAQVGTVSIPVFSRGAITPSTQIQLAVEVAGTIKSVSPKLANGAFFKQGDVLLELDDARYRYELAQVRSQLAVAKESYARVKDEIEIDSNAGNLPADLRLPAAQRNRRLSEADAQLKSANAAVELVKIQLSKTKLRAPFDGRVLKSEVGRGQTLSPGRPVAQVYAVDAAEVRLPLTDEQLGLIDVPQLYEDEVITSDGPNVTLRMTYGADKFYWQGKIVRSEGGIDPLNRLLYLVAEIESPYARDDGQPNRPPLTAGRFLEAQIDGVVHKNIVVLPRDVVRYGNQIWVVDQANRLQKREVSIRHKSRDVVYIDKGIVGGDLVVVTPMDVAVSGMKVKVSYADEDKFNSGGTKIFSSDGVGRQTSDSLKRAGEDVAKQSNIEVGRKNEAESSGFVGQVSDQVAERAVEAKTSELAFTAQQKDRVAQQLAAIRRDVEQSAKAARASSAQYVKSVNDSTVQTSNDIPDSTRAASGRAIEASSDESHSISTDISANDADDLRTAKVNIEASEPVQQTPIPQVNSSSEHTQGKTNISSDGRRVLLSKARRPQPLQESTQ